MSPIQEDGTITVSHSEAECFTRCKRQHYYNYGLFIGPKGDHVSNVAYRGTIMHLALSEYFTAWKNGADKQQALEVLIGAVVENRYQDGKYEAAIISKLCVSLEGWHKFFADEIAGWKILAVEEEFPLDITPQHKTSAFPDLVVRIPGQGYTVIDHKSVYNFMPDQMYEIGTQLPKYLAAVRRKYDVHHVGYNEVRWRPIASVDPADHYKMRFIKITDKRQIRALTEHVMISNQINMLRIVPFAEWDTMAYRTANTQVCNSCSFKDICASDMRGEDQALMVETMYQPKTRRELTVADDGA